jgi:hypothetical protein
MPNWWARKAQRELAEGVDADLVSANRKRWTLGSKLFVVGALLLAIDWLWRLPRWVHLVVASIVFVLIVTASITSKWAQAQPAFLGRAERKEPPSLFKPD